MNEYEAQLYSQNGEDGITLELLKRLYDNINSKYYVEFGTQDARECNTRILREYHDWRGLLMDGSHENEAINLKKEFITKENIIDLFKKYEVPHNFNLLSIDIDFNDFYVLHEIIKNYSVDIIILEYNAHFLPNEDAVIQYKPEGMWDGTNYFGASLKAFKNMLNFYNYSLVTTDSLGINAYFVKNDVLEPHRHKFNNIDNLNALYNTPKYGCGPRGGHAIDRLNREYVKSSDMIPELKNNASHGQFDIVIPVGPDDLKVIRNQIEYTKKNIVGYRNIYIISCDPTFQLEGCININEGVFPFNMQTVREKHGVYPRNGWYLQQLIKLYAGVVIDGILDRYLVIDADTYFLKPTNFITDDGKCMYNFGFEYHIPYFEHMLRLHPNFMKVYANISGICHHMIFETKYIKEIFDIIEKEHNASFYNVFLHTVDIQQRPGGSGASEYEIYFNYMAKYHPDDIVIRQLKWDNLGEVPKDNNGNYDYISYHWYLRKN